MAGHLEAPVTTADRDEAAVAVSLGRALRQVGREQWFVVRPDVHAVPYLDGYLLYSPLQGLLLLVSRAGLASLLLSPEAAVAACLSRCGIEADAAVVAQFDTRPRQWPGRRRGCDDEFAPCHLTLSTTSACSMACTYCYIRGGDYPRHMEWELARAAVQVTVGNAQEQGYSTYELDFHGQGEPTANWPVLRRAVRLAEDECSRRGLTPRFSLVTNGVLTRRQVAFLASHRVRVGLSMDGLRSTMEAQRPLRSGRSSFDRVVRTLRAFETADIDFTVRGTVTELSVGAMTEFVSFLGAQTRCRFVDFEPVFGVGRAADNRLDGVPLMDRFVASMRQCRDEGSRYGVEVGFSTCRLDGLRRTFCSGYGPDLNFCVSTEGLVSSCYEVLESSDPRAAIFVYGRFERASGRFVLDPDRLRLLRELTVEKMGRCGDCYVKWNCGGDCLAKAALAGPQRLTDDAPLDRCMANRAIIIDGLLRALVQPSRHSTGEGGLEDDHAGVGAVG
jgi:uncharacterized protein